ncbi:hypothetical protein GWN63_00240, partial [Candidatus Bathyarchaeota archaeon]|nr:hypothetical protein [Candidatus Bathyarchaeota archaeon]NIV67293.1 hypothetical protein [Candidatus Bathyarchaeota archaeon]
MWLPQSLITKCISHELAFCQFQDQLKGQLYAGVDLGKHQDPSVVAVVNRKDEGLQLV